MKVTVRSDKVVIDGYVNAVDRFSRPLFDGAIGRFVEKILPNVFKRAISRAKRIDVLLDHNPDRVLASTADGTAKIFEDNVGLRAIAEITDAEVVEKARAGKLRGWSFGFNNAEDTRTTNADGVVERVVTALDLFEVSIIDDRMLPAYVGTSIETRAVSGQSLEIRAGDDMEVDTNVDDTKTDDDANDAAAEAGDDLSADDLERQRQLREAAIAVAGA